MFPSHLCHYYADQSTLMSPYQTLSLSLSPPFDWLSFITNTMSRKCITKVWIVGKGAHLSLHLSSFKKWHNLFIKESRRFKHSRKTTQTYNNLKRCISCCFMSLKDTRRGSFVENLITPLGNYIYRAFIVYTKWIQFKHSRNELMQIYFGPPQGSEEGRTRLVVPNHKVAPGDTHPSEAFPDNSICTTKYTFLSFLPKNLFEQFHRWASVREMDFAGAAWMGLLTCWWRKLGEF